MDYGDHSWGVARDCRDTKHHAEHEGVFKLASQAKTDLVLGGYPEEGLPGTMACFVVM